MKRLHQKGLAGPGSYEAIHDANGFLILDDFELQKEREWCITVEWPDDADIHPIRTVQQNEAQGRHKHDPRRM
jgi:hypothetical protein